jgi:hypothetical protein
MPPKTIKPVKAIVLSFSQYMGKKVIKEKTRRNNAFS